MAFGDKMREALQAQAPETPDPTPAPEPVPAPEPSDPPPTAPPPEEPPAPVSAARRKYEARLAAKRKYQAKVRAKKAASRPPPPAPPTPAAEALAEDLIAELDEAPAAQATPVTMTMEQVLQLMAAAKGDGFDEAALTRVLTAVQQTHAKASADAMQTALNRSNINYISQGPFHYANGKEAVPKYTVFFGPQFTNGRGAALPRDLFSPDECDLINRFELGPQRIARNGAWTAEVFRNGSTHELVIKVPMTTMDQRQNLPSLTLILRELLDGELAVNPDTLAARVAELERKLAATAA